MTNKTIADFFEVYRPKSPDEQKFVDKHVVIKHKDRNGNGDDVFNAKNIKKADRKKERHGYEPGEDEKVYESFEAASKRAEASRQRAIKKATIAFKRHGNMDHALRDHDLSAKDATKIKAMCEEIEQVDAAFKKAKGYNGTPKKPVAEDVEQIDEIGNTKAGRATLAKYIVNRTDDMVSNAYNTGRGKLDNGKDFNKTMEREVKHKEGIMNAAVRLAKPRKFRRYYGEELASSFVDKYMPEQSDMPALTNEERLVSVLMDQNISEAISVDVLALHSTLDEQNQRLLIDNIMEGQIDDVVDFAIQNRN